MAMTQTDHVVLYRCSWNCEDYQNRQQWFTSRADAIRFARNIADGAAVDRVRINVTPQGLAEWLDKHFWTDNG